MGGRGSGRVRRNRRPAWNWKHISQRERELLQMLANGKVPKEVAVKQRSTYRSIQQLMYRLRIALAARTTHEMVAIGIRKGIVR